VGAVISARVLPKRDAARQVKKAERIPIKAALAANPLPSGAKAISP
jgi:hypothetical protein